MTAHDTVLVAVAMDRCFMAGLAYWLGLRELGCGVVRTGAASPVLVLEMIERVQPTGDCRRAVVSATRCGQGARNGLGFEEVHRSRKRSASASRSVIGRWR